MNNQNIRNNVLNAVSKYYTYIPAANFDIQFKCSSYQKNYSYPSNMTLALLLDISYKIQNHELLSKFEYGTIKQTKNEQYFGGCTVYYNAYYGIHKINLHVHVSPKFERYYINMECKQFKITNIFLDIQSIEYLLYPVLFYVKKYCN